MEAEADTIWSYWGGWGKNGKEKKLKLQRENEQGLPKALGACPGGSDFIFFSFGVNLHFSHKGASGTRACQRTCREVGGGMGTGIFGFGREQTRLRKS